MTNFVTVMLSLFLCINTVNAKTWDELTYSEKYEYKLAVCIIYLQLDPIKNKDKIKTARRQSSFSDKIHQEKLIDLSKYYNQHKNELSELGPLGCVEVEINPY